MKKATHLPETILPNVCMSLFFHKLLIVQHWLFIVLEFFVQADFVGHCLLFGELLNNGGTEVVVDDWGSDSTCSYVSWTNALVLCFGVFLGAYLMAMCCTGREAFGLELVSIQYSAFSELAHINTN